MQDRRDPREYKVDDQEWTLAALTSLVFLGEMATQ